MENHIGADSVSYNDTRSLLAESTMVTMTDYYLFCLFRFLQNMMGTVFMFYIILYIYNTLYKGVW